MGFMCSVNPGKLLSLRVVWCVTKETEVSIWVLSLINKRIGKQTWNEAQGQFYKGVKWKQQDSQPRNSDTARRRGDREKVLSFKLGVDAREAARKCHVGSLLT